MTASLIEVAQSSGLPVEERRTSTDTTMETAPQPGLDKPPIEEDNNDDDSSLGLRIQEMTNRFNQVSLFEIDPDDNINSGEEIVEFKSVEKLTEIVLEFPIGRLGFTLKKDRDGDTLVDTVKEYCKLRDYVLLNDILLKVGDFEARKASLPDVAAEVKKKLLDKPHHYTWSQNN